MNGLEQLKQYDFHDSLLENISYNEDKNIIILKIDFCNWRQKWYTEKYEETSEISLTFDGATDVIIPDIPLNSDTIIDIELLKVNGKTRGIKMVAFNDIENSSYEIIINSVSVFIEGMLG